MIAIRGIGLNRAIPCTSHNICFATKRSGDLAAQTVAIQKATLIRKPTLRYSNTRTSLTRLEVARTSLWGPNVYLPETQRHQSNRCSGNRDQRECGHIEGRIHLPSEEAQDIHDLGVDPHQMAAEGSSDGEQAATKKRQYRHHPARRTLPDCLALKPAR